MRERTMHLDGARGRNRTGTAVKPRDFKSLVSTNFTTRAYGVDATVGALFYHHLGFLPFEDNKQQNSFKRINKGRESGHYLF